MFDVVKIRKDAGKTQDVACHSSEAKYPQIL